MAQQAQCRRIMDVMGEANLRSPIFGLKNVPVVTLAAALAYAVTAGVLDNQLVSVVQFCAYEFADDKLLAGPDPNQLTREEIAAIHAYTQASDLYDVLNEVLRSENRASVKPFFAYIVLLLTALFKLPLRSGMVYRGVTKAVSDLTLNGMPIYVKSRRVVWWAFSSTTSSIGVLVQPDFLGETGQRTMFNINLSTGFSIQQYSAFGGESEVLAIPGTCFMVEDILPQGDLTIIQLAEDTTAPSLIDFQRPVVGPAVSVSSEVAATGIASVATVAEKATTKFVVKHDKLPVNESQSRHSAVLAELTRDTIVELVDVAETPDDGRQRGRIVSPILGWISIKKVDGSLDFVEAVQEIEDAGLPPKRQAQEAISEKGVDDAVRNQKAALSPTWVRHAECRDKAILENEYYQQVLSMKDTKEVNLDSKGIGNFDAKAIAEALPHVRSLVALYLGTNSIGDAGVEAIAAALPQCREVAVLHLAHNQIGLGGARAIVSVLPKLKNLSMLDLSCNNIGVAGAQALRQAWARAGKEEGTLYI